MPNDHSGEMKARMRGDLVAAIKGKRPDEVALLRSLLAAIDNAEAPPARTQSGSMTRGPSEIERLVLTRADVQAVLAEEIRTRRQAAAELARLGHGERAEALLGQAAITERYVAPLE